MIVRFGVLAIGVAILSFESLAQTPDTVSLEELTWTEVRDAMTQINELLDE